MKTTKTHATTKDAKAERRSRREAKERRRRADWTVTHLGGPLDEDRMRRTVDAFLGGIRPDDPWEDVQSSIVPMLRRVRHPFPPEMGPLELRVPPGVVTSFAMDVGPALAYVSSVLIARWAIDEATLLGTALDNLRRRVIEEPPLVERAVHRGTPITVVQAQGWGSALILAPDRLAPLIGDAPRTLLTPVRNTLVVLPEDVDVDVAVDIWEAFADQARDELDVQPLLWTGSDVVLGEPRGGGRLD